MKNLLLAIGAFAALSVGAYAVATSSLGAPKQVPAAVTAEDTNSETPQYGVSIGTVEAQDYNESGLDVFGDTNVQYVAKVSTAYLGFNTSYDYYGNLSCSLAAVCSFGEDEYITIPDYIKIGDYELPVSIIYLTFYGGAPKGLTIPSTVGDIRTEYHSYTYPIDLTDYYFLGTAPNIGGFQMKVYVCNKSAYSSFFNYNIKQNFEYYTNIQPYGWDFDWVTVNVEKPGEFAETYLTQNDYDWANGIYVKVTGNISDADLNAMKSLSALQKLDLSETSITSIPAYFMQDRQILQEVALPQTVTTIGMAAFEYCYSLTNFDLGNVVNIANSCFSDCNKLEYIDLSNVETVESCAFFGCNSLTNIDFSNLKTIGDNAFHACTSLTNVNATSATTIDAAAFQFCAALETADISAASTIRERIFDGCTKLNNVTLFNSLTSIPNRAFQDCTSLTSIEIPSTVTQIDYEAFRGCSSLTEITLPASLRSIGKNALSGTGLTTVKCKAVAPPAATASFVGDMDMTRTYLYVPPFSKDFYRNTQYWSDFYLMRDLDEPVDYICVDRELTINLDEDYDVLGYNPDMELTNGITYNEWGDIESRSRGQLTATGEGTLSVGQLDVSANLAYDEWNEYGYAPNSCPTLINYADKMRADNVTHTFTFSNKGTWYFISLPYDVKVSDIEPSEGTYWVIRRYDGDARAAGETAWIDLTADDTMEAYKGYIISATCADTCPSLTFTSGNSLTKNNMFTANGVIVPLEEHAAEFAHNRSWNLVGNPFPAYFDMHNLNEEFTAAITVWNGYSYTAFSPVDDDYVLRPYEAFFVQCPLNLESMTFNEAGRMHTETATSASAAPAAVPATVDPEGRNVFNFNMTGENVSDRARIVLNPAASMDYELDRDAAKFFSNTAAEIYVSAKDAACAIDERPVAEGTASLGLRATAEGVYTLSLSGKHSDEWIVTLTDNLSGNTVELTAGDYTFTATEGDNASRFSVMFTRKAIESGVEGILADFGADTEVAVTAVNGVNVYNGPLSGIKVATPGVYVVTAGNTSRKVTLK